MGDLVEWERACGEGESQVTGGKGGKGRLCMEAKLAMVDSCECLDHHLIDGSSSCGFRCRSFIPHDTPGRGDTPVSSTSGDG